MLRPRPLVRHIPLAARTIPLHPPRPSPAGERPRPGRTDRRRHAGGVERGTARLPPSTGPCTSTDTATRTTTSTPPAGPRRSGKGFIWLGLHEPSTDQLAQLGEVFDLHELALEDASNNRQRPKIERYDDSFFLALRTLALHRP